MGIETACEEVPSEGERITIPIAGAERSEQKDATVLGDVEVKAIKYKARKKMPIAVYIDACSKITALKRLKLKKAKAVMATKKRKGGNKKTEGGAKKTGERKTVVPKKTKSREKAERRRNLLNETVLMPLKTVRRQPTTTRHGEAYLMDASNTYVIGTTAKVTPHFGDIVQRVCQLLEQKKIGTRSEAKSAMRQLIRTWPESA